jgi:hypothetical protein
MQVGQVQLISENAIPKTLHTSIALSNEKYKFRYIILPKG